MKHLIRILLFIILSILSGCDRYFDSSPILVPIRERSIALRGDLIWVGKMFVGGIQCDTFNHYSPPNTKDLLNSVGIPVVDTMIQYYYVCAACGCPTYAAKHFALIDKRYLPNAEQLGFIPQPLPWLYVYTDKKQYTNSDIINFTVDNPTNQIAFIMACNNKLSFWLEMYKNNQWIDIGEINTTCISLFPTYIKLLPNYSIKEQLNLQNIDNLTNGTYRIKIKYMLENIQYNYEQYSNTFVCLDME